jgi:hypothetical protein
MNDNIRKHLLTMREVLEFVEEVDALPKIRNLQSTVSSMMKQIYECSLFIQEYTKLGLASMCPQLPSMRKWLGLTSLI